MLHQPKHSFRFDSTIRNPGSSLPIGPFLDNYRLVNHTGVNARESIVSLESPNARPTNSADISLGDESNR